MRAGIVTRYVLPAATLVFLLVLWQVLVAALNIPALPQCLALPPSRSVAVSVCGVT